MKTRVAYFGVFTALALILSYVETLIPIPIGIPGVKLGLANLIIVIALYRIEFRYVCLLSIVRVVLAGFMFGSMYSIFYSLSGAIVSLAVMCLLKYVDKFSVYGVSIAGGVFHNVGQLIMAMTVLESVSLIYYLPVLLISGMLTGLLIGLLSNEVLKRVKKL